MFLGVPLPGRVGCFGGTDHRVGCIYRVVFFGESNHRDRWGRCGQSSRSNIAHTMPSISRTANPIHNGLSTHHQVHVMTPQSFSTMKQTVKTHTIGKWLLLFLLFIRRYCLLAFQYGGVVYFFSPDYREGWGLPCPAPGFGLIKRKVEIRFGGRSRTVPTYGLLSFPPRYL